MIPPQTFHLSDLGKIGFLLVLEALLSADNALILAIIVRHLPSKALQRKALFYGLMGAFVLRFGAILLAGIILNFWWLQFLGAAYLVYLPVRHFSSHSPRLGKAPKKPAGFWMTVLQAEFADIAFALDSVLVAVAVVHDSSKLWVVYAGAILGLLLLRFAANYCLALLERFPVLDHVAYVLVGWAGLKLLFVSGHTFEQWFIKKFPGQSPPFHVPEMPPSVFWLGMALIVVFGVGMAIKQARKSSLTKPAVRYDEPAQAPGAMEEQEPSNEQEAEDRDHR